MPIYEYQCVSCTQVHEVLQKFSDPPLASCPQCSAPVKKLMSLSSFALKGTGWYTTDYKGKAKQPSTSSVESGTTVSPAGNPAGNKVANDSSGSSTAAGSGSSSPTTAPSASSPSPSTGGSTSS